MAADTSEVRTYGNWRRPHSAGLGQLGTLGTGLLFGGAIVTVMILAFAGIIAALLFAVITGGVLALVAVRNRHGRTLLEGAATRTGYQVARAHGWHLYRSGALSPAGGRCELPGIAAQSRVREFTDSRGDRFAMITVPQRDHHTVVFSADPDGASLVDPDQIDTWVAKWGGWLATMSIEPGIEQIAVTIDTTPDTGGRLQRELDRTTRPDAPPVTVRMLNEVQAAAPAGSAMVRATIAVTWHGRQRGRRRHVERVAADLANRVPHFADQLHATGAGATRAMTSRQLCELVRTAYDPAAATVFEQARIAGAPVSIVWGDVGPKAARAEWDHYRHDSGVSVTWSMTLPPQGHVTAHSLEAVLRPHPDIARKRVTLLYRPIPAAQTRRIVQRDIRNARFRERSRREAHAHESQDRIAAEQTATEAAKGAALVDFSILITATVTEPGLLEQARSAMDILAPTTGLQIRPEYGVQDSAFAASLPLGIVARAHSRVPAVVRDNA